MATNYIQMGRVVELTAPANLSSGDGLLVGSLFGVATKDAASGDPVQAALEGVFELPKATGAITEGAKVYWDNAAKNVTTTASGNSLIGAAVRAAASGDGVVRVRLNAVAI